MSYLNGPLLINLLKDRQLNGCVWMSMASKLSTSTDHLTRNYHQHLFRCFNISVSILVTLAGDLHTGWGYDFISPDEECLANWAAHCNHVLFHNLKNAPSFFSGRWHTGTNPDLVFASVGLESWSVDRRILEKFLWSQHRPSLITAAKLVTTVPSTPHKRWNYSIARLTGNCIALSLINWLRTYHLQTPDR